MNVKKNEDGSYSFSAIKNGYLVTQRYHGYTKKEATKLFQEKLEKRDY